MKKLFVAGLIAIAVMACVNKPEPWSPDTAPDSFGDAQGRSIDGRGDFGIQELVVKDIPTLELSDGNLDGPDSPETVLAVDVEDGSDEVGDVVDIIEALDICQPECAGKQCGDNGCGGSCGECSCGVCIDALCTPQEEVCDGYDNDCNGNTDEGTLCDDANNCTADSCNGAGGCANQPVELAVCGPDMYCKGGECLDRWHDLGNGAIEDVFNGWMWQKAWGGPYPGCDMDGQANAFCAGLGLAGKAGWQAPTVVELGKLCMATSDAGKYYPAVFDAPPAGGGKETYFLTSEGAGGGCQCCKNAVDFGTAECKTIYGNQSNMYVRCVNKK